MSAAALACVAEPVSWPRLERFAAGALDGGAAAEIAAHVEACAACRSCLDEIRADVVALPPLPAVPVRAPAPRRWARWLVAGGGLAVAAAAVLLLWARPRGGEAPGPFAGAPGPHVAVKGAGAVVLSVVRERDGRIAFDPRAFRAGDRFKLRVTCDPGPSVWADVVVYQADRPGGPPRAAFPLSPRPVPCGNQATVPGAFTITGDAPALVCVSLATGAPPDRAAVGGGPRGGQLACAVLAPE